MADEPEVAVEEQPAEQVVVETPVVEAAPADPKVVEAAFSRLPGLLKQAFEGDLTDEETEAVAKGITPETFRELQPTAQATLRVALRAMAKMEAGQTEAQAKRDEEFAKKEADFAKSQAAFRRKEQALLAVQATSRDPGPRPKVDVLTPEGQVALIDHAAKQARFDAEAPAREHADRLDRQARWDAIVEANADLKDPKVSAEFDAFMAKQNEGIKAEDVAAGKAVPRVDAATGARMFFNERKLAKLEAEQKAAVQRQHDDRAAGMRATARATAGGVAGGGAVAFFNDYCKKNGYGAAETYLVKNPAFHKQLQAEQAAS